MPSLPPPLDVRGDDPLPSKLSELKAFLFLTVVTAPVIAVGIIATYGLIVWIYQVFAGPPTH